MPGNMQDKNGLGTLSEDMSNEMSVQLGPPPEIPPSEPRLPKKPTPTPTPSISPNPEMVPDPERPDLWEQITKEVASRFLVPGDVAAKTENGFVTVREEVNDDWTLTYLRPAEYEKRPINVTLAFHAADRFRPTQKWDELENFLNLVTAYTKRVLIMSFLNEEKVIPKGKTVWSSAQLRLAMAPYGARFREVGPRILMVLRMGAEDPGEKRTDENPELIDLFHSP